MAPDVAADNIAAVVGQREVAGGAFLVTVDACYNMADMTRVLCREHGYAFTYYDISGFIAQMNPRCARADPCTRCSIFSTARRRRSPRCSSSAIAARISRLRAPAPAASGPPG